MATAFAAPIGSYLGGIIGWRRVFWAMVPIGSQMKKSRTRLLLEAFDAVAEVFGAERVGVRIAPFGNFGDMKRDAKAEETFLYLAEELTRRGAAYIHVVRGSQFDVEPVVPFEFFQKLRKAFGGSIIITGGLDQEKAEDLLTKGVADLLGFGISLISNPDLPERFRNGWPLAQATSPRSTEAALKATLTTPPTRNRR